MMFSDFRANVQNPISFRGGEHVPAAAARGVAFCSCAARGPRGAHVPLRRAGPQGEAAHTGPGLLPPGAGGETAACHSSERGSQSSWGWVSFPMILFYLFF